MAEKALGRLRNLLTLEAQTQLREKAFAGGVSAFRDRWMNDAKEDGVHPGLIQEICDRLTQYAAAEGQDRERLLRGLRDLLEQPAADPMLANVDQVGSAPPPVPQYPPPPRAEATRREGPAELKQGLPVTELKGVGAKKATQYAQLGVHTLADLVWHLPRRYDDFSRIVPIADCEEGDALSIVANLVRFSERKFSYKRQITQAIFSDGSGQIRVTWWNQPWIKDKLVVGKLYRLSGAVGLYMGWKTLENPIFEQTTYKALKSGPILPVYPLTQGLSNRDVSRHVDQALRLVLPEIEDPFPEELRKRYGLMALSDALRQVHQPSSAERLAAARQRLAFDEFIYIQLGVQRRRQEISSHRAPAMAAQQEALAAFQAALPFTLTGAQQRVLGEIMQDLAQTLPMSRMVQGDVGSGKTAVCAGAMLVAAANGCQSALLAPTQILAEQHFRGLSRLLEGVRLPDGTQPKLVLLTGRVTGQERAQGLEALASGAAHIAVGTTALIQEGVEFDNLGLVVVDEQHRFGVQQRATLRDKHAAGVTPHLLVMSATPIPRSLALTIYGDLDISVIDEMPPGRTPIKTKLFTPLERERLYAFLRRQVQAGRQGYIIYPLVEESEVLEAGAAVNSYERLRTEVFPQLRLGLLHGRLKGSEKDEVMLAFAQGELDILVSTTVVEVGVDVPNATVMLIEDADRFGLAQLHQLRGRVGRGAHESYCALISRVDKPASLERLNALVETTDGFKLAEKDLELRGPGDFLGTRQSGLPDLKMATLSDTATLALAQQAAQEILAASPDLDAYPQLRERVELFWRGHGDIS